METKNTDQPINIGKKKKRSLKVKITAWFITSFIMLLFGSPFIALGILIGWWIWH